MAIEQKKKGRLLIEKLKVTGSRPWKRRRRRRDVCADRKLHLSSTYSFQYFSSLFFNLSDCNQKL
jgi:hypothetical protein